MIGIFVLRTPSAFAGCRLWCILSIVVPRCVSNIRTDPLLNYSAVAQELRHGWTPEINVSMNFNKLVLLFVFVRFSERQQSKNAQNIRGVSRIATSVRVPRCRKVQTAAGCSEHRAAASVHRWWDIQQIHTFFNDDSHPANHSCCYDIND